MSDQVVRLAAVRFIQFQVIAETVYGLDFDGRLWRGDVRGWSMVALPIERTEQLTAKPEGPFAPSQPALDPPGDFQVCPFCGGTGFDPDRGALLRGLVATPCQPCQGKGVIVVHPLPAEPPAEPPA